MENPVGLNGIEFVEFASPNPENLEVLFRNVGFHHEANQQGRDVRLFRQNDIQFLINNEPSSYAKRFSVTHGPSLPSMGWRVKDSDEALEQAVKRGAKPFLEGDYRLNGHPVPAIVGIGGSLIYFIDKRHSYEALGFRRLESKDLTPPLGFTVVDHLTNNVAKGELDLWANFYKNIFGFREVRYFDIRGEQTGLLSHALRSPCGKFCIPINEGTEEKSQINEFLREYKGAGIQHLALASEDLLESLESIDNRVDTLEIDDTYYNNVFDRVPNVTEDHERIKNLQVLVDGDESGYILQIFSKNVVGPFFFEFIQRKNHQSFGEGNFGALFRSIEKDQERRGVL